MPNLENITLFESESVSKVNGHTTHRFFSLLQKVGRKMQEILTRAFCWAEDL